MNVTHSISMEEVELLFNQKVFFCKNWGIIKVQKFELRVWRQGTHTHTQARSLTAAPTMLRVKASKAASHIRQCFTWINIFSYSNLHAAVVCRRVKFSWVTPNSTIKPPLHSHNPPSPLQEILPLTPLTFFDSRFGEFDKLPQRCGKCVKPAVFHPFDHGLHGNRCIRSGTCFPMMFSIEDTISIPKINTNFLTYTEI